ncbi:unnamed protein product [Blepharisma stoltei]|uniref:Uncharacterized protein n=1 Tax=Blepharisma stoltei TaxID=1481888 RepID=A0AAU9IAB9_9CILI|nr:unnamed protein product [Blepharisma stoltei]
MFFKLAISISNSFFNHAKSYKNMITLWVIIFSLFVFDCYIFEKHLKFSLREKLPTMLFLLFAANYIPLLLSQIISKWISALTNEIDADFILTPIVWLNPIWNLTFETFHYLFDFIWSLFWIFGIMSLLGTYSSSKSTDNLISCFLAMANAMCFLIYYIFSSDENVLILYLTFFTIFSMTWINICKSKIYSNQLDLAMAWYNLLFLINTLWTIKILCLPNTSTFDILKFIFYLVSYLWITFFILFLFLICYVSLFEYLQTLFNEFIERFKRVHDFERNYLNIIKVYAVFMGFIIEMIFANNLISWIVGEEIWVVKEGLLLIGVGAYGHILIFPDEDQQQMGPNFSNIVGAWFQAWIVKRILMILIT